MKPTRTRTLLLVGVLAAVVTWALLNAVYASLPPLTWTGVPALLIAAGVEAWAGRDLRARIGGKRGTRPAPPLFVARIVALAKASSQTAALLAGICAGFMVYLSGKASAPTPHTMIPTVRRRAPGTSFILESSAKPTVEMVMTAMYTHSPKCQRPQVAPRRHRAYPESSGSLAAG